MPIYSTTLFLFRRDLRLIDNTALNQALHQSERVIPGFIFDPEQIQPHPYQSRPGLQFMLSSLRELAAQLQAAGGELAVFQAPPAPVVKQLFEQQRIEAVFINRDYTPFSRQRDAELMQVCSDLGIALHVLPDALLNEPEQVLKSDQTPYKVFTAFYHRARQRPIALPRHLAGYHFATSAIGTLTTENWPVTNRDRQDSQTGGRQQALHQLERLVHYQDYLQTRDYPAIDGNSRLSPHLKFGTCSIREVYYAIVEQLGAEHPLLRQLYWRDFFSHIAHHFPSVFGHAFLTKFDTLQWDNNPDYFQAWQEGRTGFPIVDAGMRELNHTGFMHNRVRMITASFLVKDLRIDWRLGERYFAQHLVDYDPCVNNGNWQWAASTGCDAQPYFRIFNPWTQQKKFDPECHYIYRWLPELQDVPINILHQWDKKHRRGTYPAPMIDHALQSRLTKALFKSVSPS